MSDDQKKIDSSTERGHNSDSIKGSTPDGEVASFYGTTSNGALRKERKGRLRVGSDLYADLSPSNGSDVYEQDFFQRRPPSRNMHWSIAWSDLMMTMFILFMVMFVYKTADREFLSGEGLGSFSGEEIGREATKDGPGGSNEFNVFGEKAFSKIYDFSKLTTLEKDIKEFAEIGLDPDKTLRIILTGDLLFPIGETRIVGDGLVLLRKIAIFLKDTPYKINVVGHTDNIPVRNQATSSNWELSANRASAVAQYLIAETKLPAGQFYVTGHAEYRPVVPNDSPENRAKNRRVEIVITKEMPGALPFGSADL